jgi:hypothetical protein
MKHKIHVHIRASLRFIETYSVCQEERPLNGEVFRQAMF